MATIPYPASEVWCKLTRSEKHQRLIESLERAGVAVGSAHHARVEAVLNLEAKGLVKYNDGRWVATKYLN